AAAGAPRGRPAAVCGRRPVTGPRSGGRAVAWWCGTCVILSGTPDGPTAGAPTAAGVRALRTAVPYGGHPRGGLNGQRCPTGEAARCDASTGLRLPGSRAGRAAAEDRARRGAGAAP